MNFRNIIIILFMLSGVLGAQNPQSSLILRFFDSVTGVRIVPEALAIEGQGFENIWRSPSDFEGELQQENLAVGNYKMVALADGYLPMETVAAIESNKIARYDFYLQAQNGHPLLAPEYIHTLKRNDATLICGFVSDEKGNPLQDVQVLTNNGGISTTDHNGYFRTYISTNLATGEITLEKEGFRSEYRRNIELWSGGDWAYRIRLSKGNGLVEVDEDREARVREQMEVEDCATCPKIQPGIAPEKQDPALLRSTIRVGRNCSGTFCTSVEVYTLQDYCKFVLPGEWFSCWGSLSNGMNSLQAGAVGIRTYASWHVYNPISVSYDICDNTSCQFFGSNLSSNATAAVNMTERFVMIDGNGNVPRSEYSAENNNAGCGDGFCGTGTATAPCISDPICAGQTLFGHGRGMCQYGTIRWANGTVIARSVPCSSGPAHGSGTKTWQEIIDHYYPNYTLTQGASASLIDVVATPGTASPGQRITLEYEIDAAPSISVLLDAEIAINGTTSYTSDEDDEDLVGLVPGYNLVTRGFDLPASLATGSYDLRATLYYDLDENSQINFGDFRMDRVKYLQVLEVTPTGIEPVSDIVPEKHRLYQNFPNPFNPETRIGFAVAELANVRLEIFNPIGERVAELLNETLAAGEYEQLWNGQEMASGTYLYRLTVTPLSGGKAETLTRKLVLAR